jgi:uncharacterized NAD-dependent epimerase/dehydratase family protein
MEPFDDGVHLWRTIGGQPPVSAVDRNGRTDVSDAGPDTGKRYLVLAEGCSDDPYLGKTARGILNYGITPAVAVVDSTRTGETEHGVPFVSSPENAFRYGPTTAVVGIAPAGGSLPPEWRQLVKECIAGGLDVESGLHEFMADDAEFAELAAQHSVEVRDLRRPPLGLGVTSGENLRLPAKAVLTVGSDCAIGKMTVSLELDRAARRRGIQSIFVPTGQTGIAIAGWGIAIDCVVSDFIAGAAERLVVEGARRGADVLMVEGQGSITHPAYSGVTLGLIHGSAPDVYVLCHKAGAAEHEGFPGHPLASLSELVEIHERLSLAAKPATVAAIALNTGDLDERAANEAIEAAAAETGLPADDPVRHGADYLLDAVLDAVDVSGSPASRRARTVST